MSGYWEHSTPPSHTHHSPATEYSYTASAPRSPRYHTDTNPQYSRNSYEYYLEREYPYNSVSQYVESAPPQLLHSGYHAYPYANTEYPNPSIPEIGGLNIATRSPSPQYVGRRSNSHTSSKASNSGNPIYNNVPRQLRRTMSDFQGYKPPTVETAPNSPILLPSLSSDAGTVFDENPDYTPPQYDLPKTTSYASQTAHVKGSHFKWPQSSPFPQNTNFRFERERTPYGSSSTSSTAASSPPSEKIHLERERRQYSSRKDHVQKDVPLEKEQNTYVSQLYSSIDPPSIPEIKTDQQDRDEQRPSTQEQVHVQPIPRCDPQPYGQTNTDRDSERPFTQEAHTQSIPRCDSQLYGQINTDGDSDAQRPFSQEQVHTQPIPRRDPQFYGQTNTGGDRDAQRPCTQEQAHTQPIPRRDPQSYGQTNVHQESYLHTNADGLKTSELPWITQNTPKNETYTYGLEGQHLESENRAESNEFQYSENVYSGSLTFVESPTSYSQASPDVHPRIPHQITETSAYHRATSGKYPEPVSNETTLQGIERTMPVQEPHQYPIRSPALPNKPSSSEHRDSTRSEEAREDAGVSLHRPKTPKVPAKVGPSCSQPPTPITVVRSSVSDSVQYTSRPPSTPLSTTQSLVRCTTSPGPELEFLELVPVCPKRNMVNRGHWYGIPSIPGYHICERCYEVHVYETEFRNSFEEITLALGEWTYCAFNTPRILKAVWPQTLARGRFDIFQTYATHRSKLPSCRLVARSVRGLWYTLPTGVLQPGFIACQACYEDVIQVCRYRQYFTPLDAANPGGLGSCHLQSAPFIEAQMVDDDLTWQQFCRQIEYRLHEVPQCPKDKLVTDTKRTWWRPRGTQLPIMICAVCYSDGVFPTLYAQEFDTVHQETKKDKWFCSMGAFQLSLVWKQAVEKKDYRLWLNAAIAALSPMCSSDGMFGGDWNAFSDEKLEGFDFCDRCADMYVKPLGFVNYTEKRRYAPNERVWCGFSSQYREEILQKLGEAADWRDFDIFKEYLAQRVSTQSCPGIKGVVRYKWWGNDEICVCTECWKFRVRLSPLAEFFRELRPRRPDREVCGLGTDEPKRWWGIACERRDYWMFIDAVRINRSLHELRRGRKEVEGRLNTSRRGGPFEDRRRDLRQRLVEFQRAEEELMEDLQVLTSS